MKKKIFLFLICLEINYGLSAFSVSYESDVYDSEIKIKLHVAGGAWTDYKIIQGVTPYTAWPSTASGFDGFEIQVKIGNNYVNAITKTDLPKNNVFYDIWVFRKGPNSPIYVIEVWGEEGREYSYSQEFSLPQATKN